jgi:diguanylate cyclase (GGDEF)-like protein/PAS domain S-box-containing protein
MNETNPLKSDALANLRGVIIYSLDNQYRYMAFTTSHRDVMKSSWGIEISIGMNMLECITREDDRRKAKENFDRTMTGESFIAEKEYDDEERRIRSWWEERYAPLYNGKDDIIGLTVFVVDITERRRLEERTRFMAYMVDHVSSALIATDMDFKVIYWNKSAENLYGWKEIEALGRNIDEICGTGFAEGQKEIAQQILAIEKTWRGELKQRHRSGAEIWVDASVTLLEDERGIPLGSVTINHDVTERKLAEDELRRTKESIEQINLTLRRAFEREQLVSRTDSLTGAFNRRYFFELLEYEFAASRRYQRPLSLVMFDVDFLKKINDTWGHQTGDEILVEAVRAVRLELRDSDVLARYGGDEFVILLSSSDEQDAFTVLDRIHRRIQTTFIRAGGKKLGITISAGIASLQPDMGKPGQLVMQADRALYSAKNAGRNRLVVFDSEGDA